MRKGHRTLDMVASTNVPCAKAFLKVAKTDDHLLSSQSATSNPLKYSFLPIYSVLDFLLLGSDHSIMRCPSHERPVKFIEASDALLVLLLHLLSQDVAVVSSFSFGKDV